jgi:hypothetical protein
MPTAIASTRSARLGLRLIGIGGGVSRAPATPPGMRVRTRRFEELRSCESWYSKIVEVFDGEDKIKT